MADLAGGTAIVTGGTSGIGYATAALLTELGVNTVINSRHRTDAVDRLEALAAGRGVRSVFVPGDVAEPATAVALCRSASEAFGRIDGIVHSAGGPAPGAITAIDPSDWYSAFEVHLHSAFHLFRQAHPHLAARGGSVVFLSSAAALRGCPNAVAYQVVKASLIQLARALARDHAAEGIRVNCVAPGIIRTPFHATMSEEARQNNLRTRIPLGREGTPENVASMIVEIMRNDFITGETVVLDGGMSMRMA